MAMLFDVLAALKAVPDLAGIIVVTSDPEATAHAREAAVRVLTERAQDGYSGAVNAAACVLAQEGRSGMLAVPADIPFATREEFAALLREHPYGRAVSLVPAHDGRGTNAVLLTPPDAMSLEYEGDSFPRHVARGRNSGLVVTTRPLCGIALDVDVPSDLDHFMHGPEETEASRVFAAIRRRSSTPGGNHGTE